MPAEHCANMAGTQDMQDWFAQKAHPQEKLMRKVREAIVNADARVEECINRKCPTFTYKGVRTASSVLGSNLGTS